MSSHYPPLLKSHCTQQQVLQVACSCRAPKGESVEAEKIIEAAELSQRDANQGVGMVVPGNLVEKAVLGVGDEDLDDKQVLNSYKYIVVLQNSGTTSTSIVKHNAVLNGIVQQQRYSHQQMMLKIENPDGQSKPSAVIHCVLMTGLL